MAGINAELRDFLRAARGRLRPSDVGLTPGRGTAARRVTGLRREEVAQLAGMSVDYYARLEQGRTRQVGSAVIRALADALQLSATERDYLFTLVNTQADSSRTTAAGPGPRRPQRARPGARRLLEVLDNAPAFILGRGTAILAMNDLARALMFDADQRPVRERNLALWTFLDPEARERYVDWDTVAPDTAAMLRVHAAEDPTDPEISAIVGELSVKSDEFRRVWAAHHVFECTHGRKRFNHPVVGRLDLDYEALDIPDSPGQALHIYTAPRGSRSEEGLQHLTRWAAPTLTPDDLPLAWEKRPEH
ncbi:helix-turn-helix transcriptional regulator [Micromonospora sp. NPDC023633]|uniref:helix-turn-helix transcriptional regulator n=1 Tax=Micromonospora sp. NPDC023633 TaxID=3154320 RepID=UPI0034063042